MAAPIQVKSVCLLLFAKKFSLLYEMQQLILGISYAIKCMMEPYWGSFFNEINPGLMFGPSQAGSPNHGVGTVIEQATNGIPRKNSFKS